jgi:hypothetical protein
VAPRKAVLEQNIAATSFSFKCGFDADFSRYDIDSFNYYEFNSLDTVLIKF